jgi:hypothetical protein
MTMNINDVLNSDDEIAVSYAKRTQYLKEFLTKGAITQREYNELIEDLFDVEKINRLAITVERKAFIAEVIQLLMKVAKV